MIKKITKAALVATLLVSAGAAQASGADHYGYYEYGVILNQLGASSDGAGASYGQSSSESSYDSSSNNNPVYDPYGNLAALLGAKNHGHSCGHSCMPVSPEY